MVRPNPLFPPVTRTVFPATKEGSYTESMSRRRILFSSLAKAILFGWSGLLYPGAGEEEEEEEEDIRSVGLKLFKGKLERNAVLMLKFRKRNAKKDSA